MVVPLAAMWLFVSFFDGAQSIQCILQWLAWLLSGHSSTSDFHYVVHSAETEKSFSRCVVYSFIHSLLLPAKPTVSTSVYEICQHFNSLLRNLSL